VKKSIVFIMILTFILAMIKFPTSTIATTLTFQLEPKYFQADTVEQDSLAYIDLTSIVNEPQRAYLLYDSQRQCVWIALSWNCSLIKIDVATKNVTFYQFPWYVTSDLMGPMPGTIILDPNNNLWITIGYRGYETTQRGLAKFNPETEILTFYMNIPRCTGITFYNDYIWCSSYNYLLKINYTSGEIIKSYDASDIVDNPYMTFLATDGDYIWISDLRSRVLRFNIIDECFDAIITGIRGYASGIVATEDKIYVAECQEVPPFQKLMGTIAVINKTTLEIVTRLETAEVWSNGTQGMTTFYLMKDIFGNLWWTDYGKHIGVITVDGDKYVFDAVSLYCQYIEEVPNGSIWVTVLGSTYVQTLSSVTPRGNVGGISSGQKMLR